MNDKRLAGIERALVLAPHTDDGELGAGGFISRLLEQGTEVRYLAFSTAQQSLPDGLPPDTLADELRRAADVLGIDGSQLEIHNYQVRRLHENRQDILQHLVETRASFEPDLILMPSTNDIHQDHIVVAQEGIRAFKHSTILSYEIPWNNLVFEVSAFVRLAERHVERKIAALGCYESQRGRPYMNAEFIMSQARFRGVQSGVDFAEAFHLVRLVL